VIIRSVALFTHVIGMLLLFIGLAFEWRLQKTPPRLYGIALATLLASGIYLARQIGAFDLAFVRLAFGLMVLMGILGRLPATLFVRAALGLAVVYLMIDKPVLKLSLIVTGVAVAIGLTISWWSRARRLRT